MLKFNNKKAIYIYILFQSKNIIEKYKIKEAVEKYLKFKIDTSQKTRTVEKLDFSNFFALIHCFKYRFEIENLLKFFFKNVFKHKYFFNG